MTSSSHVHAPNRGLLIENGNLKSQPRNQALTPERSLSGVSQAVLFYCTDDQEYVVKGLQVGRSLIADYVVGRIGKLLGAPVPDVCLVDIPEELVGDDSIAAHFVAGIGHGSAWIPGCRDSRHADCIHEPENESRFASLMVLFGWMIADDHQFLFKKEPPMLVYSVDHGQFFPDGDEWSIDSLVRYIHEDVKVDGFLATHTLCSYESVSASVRALTGITDEIIGRTVAGVPDEWGITYEERIALASFLSVRRDSLIKSFA